MEIAFVNPGADYMIESILEFQTDAETAFWSDPLFHFYPQLDRAYAKNLSFADRKAYMERILREAYVELESTINEKVDLYAGYWAKCKEQITAALSDAFAVDCAKMFQDLRCNVSMNTIGPRFLRERYFDVFYLNSERGAIGSTIHELVHFVWFYVWNRVFQDSYDEYERPSLKWILSEMVVESVMRDERLASINPYFPRENGGCIYPYFFDMRAGGELVLDTLDAMYKSLPIEEFMRDSYAYCQEHEDAIRRHIAQAEAKPVSGQA